ncbi:MAG: heparinase II/III family protein [Litorimonas sp.]
MPTNDQSQGWTLPCHVVAGADVVDPDRPPFINLGVKIHRSNMVERFVVEEVDDVLLCDWDAQSEPSRSVRYRLNAWMYFVPMLARSWEEERDGDRPLLERVLRFMADWERNYSFDPDNPVGANLVNDFAWYDMATGLRAALIGHVLRRVRLTGGDLTSRLEMLLRLAEDHAAYLIRQDLWSSHSNHGYYQSLGLFALVAQAPFAFRDPDALRTVAVERTRDYLSRAISDDGMLLEHSPLYHCFIFRSFVNMAPWLETSDPGEAELSRVFDRMQSSMSACFQPNDLLVPFGDSRLASIEHDLGFLEGRLSLLNDDMRALFERESRPAFEQWYPGRSTGFVAYKSWDEDRSSYFAQTAQFHSLVHKQCDDMSVYWAENGMPILSDGGRYGYEGQTKSGSELNKAGYLYSDPKRVFVESVHAHNGVEVDGSSDNRRRTPQYHSAMTALARWDDLIVTECRQLREPLVDHGRLTLFRPGRFMVIIDRLADLLERPRDFTQWTQLFPTWQMEDGEDGSYRGRAPVKTLSDLPDFPREASAFNRHTVGWISDCLSRPDYEIGVRITGSVPLSVQRRRGETEPRLEGWMSPSPLLLLPSDAICARPETATPRVVIATAVAVLGEDQDIPELEILEAEPDRLVLQATLHGVQSRWVVEETEDGFRLLETVGGDTLFDQTVRREPVERLGKADAVIRARAARRSPEAEVKPFDYYDAALDPVWPDAAIEAAQYARKQGDADRAMRYLRLAAEAGHGQGALELGMALAKEAISEDELRDAERWLLAASKARIRTAFRQLGILYMADGPLHDPGKAEAAYRQAVSMGHAGSEAALGQLLLQQGRTREAIGHLSAAMDHGNVSATMALAEVYRESGDSLDLVRAEAAYLKAVEMGHAPARPLLAEILLETGRAKDALSLLERAARDGNKIAAYKAGDLLRKGVGDIERSALHALPWFEQAARKDSRIAAYHAGLIRLDPTAGALDEGRGVEWLERAAAQGFAPAHYELGLRLQETGETEAATTHFASAAESGHAGAREILDAAQCEREPEPEVEESEDTTGEAEEES